MDIDMCPLLEGDRIIPLYTNSLKQFFSLVQYLIHWYRMVFIDLCTALFR